MNEATFKNLDGETVTVKLGDMVGFKCDIENYGRIVRIQRNPTGRGYDLTLENKNGFSGDYIGGDTQTVEHSSDIWTEG